MIGQQPSPEAISARTSLAWPLWLAMAAVALLAVVLPLLVAANPPHIPAEVARQVRTPERVVQRTELPPVEPIEFQAVDTDDARAFNATIPFVSGPNPAARPFRFAGSSEDLTRAVDCLAAAVLYETGDDRRGQEAVAQVILNRVRHPAFPKSVCGVVFQGSERATGCQFTFTCDGALARRYSDGLWTRAKQVASAALGGSVFAPVGLATHYHTDWVVPYWSASLDKLAAIDTHLFFRWTGWWGTQPAFNRAHAGGEPVIAKLAATFAAHRSGLEEVAEAAGVEPPVIIAADLLPRPMAGDPNTFLVALDSRMPAANFAALASQTCGTRRYCKFLAWTDKAVTPASVPSDPKILSAMSFSYLRDQPRGFEKALWNCEEFPRTTQAECMRQRVVVAVPVRGAAPARTQPVAVAKPEPATPLAGVRRKTGTLAPVVPTPVPATKSE